MIARVEPDFSLTPEEYVETLASILTTEALTAVAMQIQDYEEATVVSCMMEADKEKAEEIIRRAHFFRFAGRLLWAIIENPEKD